jgi:hypothetical protein
MRTHEERTREPNINSKHQKPRKNEERATTMEGAEKERQRAKAENGNARYFYFVIKIKILYI